MQKWKEKAVKLGLLGASSTSILIVLLIFFYLIKEALPFALDPGLSSLSGSLWAPTSMLKESFGILPLLTGSLLVTAIATIIAVPVGVTAAIYISEIARPAEREVLKPFIELLAALPSVVIGFFGLVVFVPLVKSVFGLSTGLTALTGALLLALMAIPTIISISEDAINSVPGSYKQASLALGASKLETIFKITVPAALSGIVASITLGIGRVIGETMAVLMVTGNAAVVTMNPLTSVRTMTATVAAEMGEVAFGSHHYRALFWVALILLGITFALNILAQKALSKYKLG
ncbi:MAG TPA: phosphate ABC transporter permease subunit PstC [Caldisericia bacterium]|nr:phosphate ABC transporter permease subunit PstC [Caldisericia bacterium]HOR47485.1 phosphate ABC transporter permease subunit PstC [Caldisericia bacterium]HOU08162.1 phosphate ABC transporter permease subunit PstC [Caldisericia bacterium]HPL89133.1 phosphate ABC transporter permease subunit PstC [Caldisericia bacterium]HQG59838.1 phosphate ABC transporter permease subunit PstC [Caldisericia bacterium]